ncbi:MAG: xylan 1,4-beta-xylosidase [Firmicutes bacterium]|nr:xylan 1,4-beta-xylosidase [Bacillota bacterium]
MRYRNVSLCYGLYLYIPLPFVLILNYTGTESVGSSIRVKGWIALKYIKIEKDTIPEKYSPCFKRSVGTGRIGLALQEEYVKALKEVQQDVGFDYIRGHGIFHDDMGIYRLHMIDGQEVEYYNFTYLDRIMDMYQDCNIKPFIEFGFMPEAMASGDQTQFYWKGNVTPPKDYAKWERLVVKTLEHLTQRYGIEETAGWYYEVWNEPNAEGFWQNADMDEYFKLYERTARAVKSVSERFRVGGPAVCGIEPVHWMVSFLEFCDKAKAPVDFLSRHCYTGKKLKRGIFVSEQELLPNDYIIEEMIEARDIIKKSAFPNLELHITEFNSSYNAKCPVHDTVFNAAYLLKPLTLCDKYCDSLSYWTFSDVFEEQDVPHAQFHGGFGMIALNNIKKPVYHAFNFMNCLKENILYRDDSAIITSDNDGISAIVWNCGEREGECPPEEFVLSIPVECEQVFIKKSRIDEEKGNVRDIWTKLGKPMYPSRKQIEILKQFAKPALTAQTQHAAGGRVEIHSDFKGNGFELIEIMFVRDESSLYINK